MLRLLIDENFDQHILRGLQRRLSSFDFLLAEQAGLRQTKDPDILAWAARENRTVLTHDLRTMVPYAKRLVLLRQNMAGVILVPKRLAIGRAINDLEVLLAVRTNPIYTIGSNTCHSNHCPKLWTRSNSRINNS